MYLDDDERERRAFIYWLRTGRALPDVSGSRLQHKFNPWHDPTNGQFTFGPGGAADQFTGGGGSMGGGGASSWWNEPGRAPKSGEKRTPVKTLPRSAVDPRKAVRTAAVVANLRRDAGTVEHHRNGYRFVVDSQQRTRSAEGGLSLGHASPRSRLHQAQAGGSDRRSGDDGGHYIAHRFNGPSDAFNHFAQNARFNRGQYRAIEDRWARALRSGKFVRVRIVPKYLGSSRRPTSIEIEWTIGGVKEHRTFPN